MQPKNHWETVYSTKSADEVSWFQEHAEHSLKLISNASVPSTASIIDIGGGASTLIDDLLARGYQNVSVLDLSKSALAIAKARLGASASNVKWLEANVIETVFSKNTYDVRHDRAVFHFLTTTEDRRSYVCQVLQAVKPGGLVIVATFAEDGPEKCSGLPVMRYGANELHAEFGAPFILLGHENELHRTPDGREQKFVYCFFRKKTA